MGLACVTHVYSSGCLIDSIVIVDAKYNVNMHHRLVMQDEVSHFVQTCPKALWTGGFATVHPLHKLSLQQIQALINKYSIIRDL